MPKLIPRLNLTERCVLNAVRSFLSFGQKGLPAMQAKALQAGQSTGYVILFILVIIFAVMLAGGGGSLFSGNEASPDYSDDVEPSPTASPSAAWSIEAIMGICDKTNISDPKAQGTIITKGTENGYVTFEVNNSGTLTLRDISGFTPSKTEFKIALSKSLGYSNNKWLVKLYSGGTKNNNTLSGGILKSVKEFEPTNCL